MSYNNWFYGLPDNFGGEENCAELRELGNTNPWKEIGIEIGEGQLPFVPGWNDQSCETENQYICQKAIIHPTTTIATTTHENTIDYDEPDEQDYDEPDEQDYDEPHYYFSGVVPQSNILVLLAIFILLLN